jgi:hypothetical protein
MYFGSSEHIHTSRHYRIGEAKNPGPNKQKLVNTNMSIYRVNIANVSHLKKNTHIIAKREFHE